MANNRRRFCPQGHDTSIKGRTSSNGCKECGIARSKAGYYADREKWLAYGRKWQKANKHKVVDSELRRVYGITLADKQRMFDEQNGKCRICSFVFKDVYSAHTDHCHKSSIVRGLLCDICNRKLLPVLELYFDRIAPGLKYLGL